MMFLKAMGSRMTLFSSLNDEESLDIILVGLVFAVIFFVLGGVSGKAPALAATTDEEILFQEDFESTDEGAIPEGWSIFSGEPIVTSEKASSGNRSLKLVDKSDADSVGLRSPQIPVKEGVIYLGRAESFNESGVSQLYVEFWDAAGVRIGVFIGNNSSKGEWQPLGVSGKAPNGSKYATLLVYAHKTNIGVSYYDRVELLKAPGQPESIFTKRDVSFTPAFSGQHSAMVKEHPRIYFTKEDIGEIKKSGFMKPNYLGERSFSVSYYGGKTVTYPLPPVQPKPMGPPPGFTAGDYPYWTGMSRQIQDRMEGLALSYVTTGGKKYADTAIKYALSLADWNTWNEFGYTSLSVAHLTFGMVAVYDMLYEELTEAERRKIREAVIEKAIKPISAVAPKKTDHNIHLLGNMAMGLAALTFLDEEEGMAQYIQMIKDWSLWYLNERVTSGNTEGLGYTSYAVDNLIRFADALGRVTGDNDLMEHPYLREELTEWVLYFMAPGFKEQVNFSDASYGPGFNITMNILANRYGNGYAGWYLTRTGNVNFTTFNGVIYSSRDFPVTPPDLWPPSKAFNMGWAALRSGWKDDDTLLAFLCGSSNLGHNHLDQNHFVLNTNGEWLIIDPGYQDYSAGPKHDVTYTTVGHNAILFDGQGQSIKGGGVMVGFLSSPLFDYVAGDATGAYLNIGISKWQRDILYMRPDYFLLFDEINTGTKERNVDLLLHTDNQSIVLLNGNRPKSGKSIEADKIGIYKPKASAVFQSLWPKGLTMTYDFYKGAEEYGPYIKISPAQAIKREDFVSLLTSEANKEARTNTKGAEPPKVSINGTENFIGLAVEGSSSDDFILYNRTREGVKDDNIFTDGRYGITSLDVNSKILRFALIGGGKLNFIDNQGGEHILVISAVPISIAFGYIDDTWSGTVEAKEEGTVQFYVPGFQEALKNGKKLAAEDYSYDANSKMITVQVEKGTNRFEFRGSGI